MKIELKKILSISNVDRIAENTFYNQNLFAISIFFYNNIFIKAQIKRLTINFSLKEVDFNKKKALPFFLVLELLTKQKCIATLSTRNLISWKLRKGMLVGCKVTLRKQKLDDFFDTLILTLPRMEKFKPWKKVLFQGKKIKPTLSVSLIELLFFYPIELGLGMNSNVKQIEFHFLFNTLLEEEKVFLLSTKKIPLSLK